MTGGTRQSWDEHATAFDEEADHGLRDSGVRRAWADLLLPVLPPAPASIVDVGCGTGSLSVLLAGAGHHVRGVDFAPRMLAAAREKTIGAGVGVDYVLADGAKLPFARSSFDVVLARHVLWALPDPDRVLAHWISLLRPQGRLVLVEGCWSTGTGLPAATCRALVLRCRREAEVRVLDDSRLWGQEITDERYLLVSSRRTQPRR
ncbi:class I SAM-dependent methyltransferase [Plantactinospora solaniradicis]|uniref:Class I SAM-dependent methyltransferase n=1 Tax=Plantactinospora solaniradicis TaxID=1723736 RepID=A0ABW1KFC7_9ACTN